MYHLKTWLFGLYALKLAAWFFASLPTFRDFLV